MQIIIVQAEIEEAIRNHIASRLRVAEGMQMTIDLSATRGADGFRATIDVTPVSGTVGGVAQPRSPVFVPPTITAAPTAPAPQALSAQAVAAASVEQVQPTAPAVVTGIFGGANGAVPRTATEVRAALEAQYAAEEEQGQVAGESADQAAASAAATESEGTKEDAAQTGDDSSDGASKPSTAARSLFKGLRRPVNG